MNKILKLSFLVSIVLNVLLIGMVLGNLPNRFDSGFRPEGRITRDLEKLPEPVRSRFREKVEQMRESRDAMRDQMSAARNEALRLLAAEPFDETAYDRKVKEIQQFRLQRAQRMSENIKEVAKGLPLEQRKALAE